MAHSDYIALASATIALSALGVALWQGYIARRHNILSVAPRLNVHRSSKNGISFELRSTGLGPAVVERFALVFQDERIENPDQDPYKTILPKIGISGATYDFHFPVPGDAWAPGSCVELLRIFLLDENRTENALETICDALEFEIAYKSMYGEQLFVYRGNC